MCCPKSVEILVPTLPVNSAVWCYFPFSFMIRNSIVAWKCLVFRLINTILSPLNIWLCWRFLYFIQTKSDIYFQEVNFNSDLLGGGFAGFFCRIDYLPHSSLSHTLSSSTPYLRMRKKSNFFCLLLCAWRAGKITYIISMMPS